MNVTTSNTKRYIRLFQHTLRDMGRPSDVHIGRIMGGRCGHLPPTKRLSDRLTLDYGIVENLFIYENSVDFGLTAGLTYRP